MKTRAEFVAELRGALGRVLPILSPAAHQLIVAHGAYETGWGNVGTAPRGFNYWNITCGKRWLSANRPQTPGSDTDGAGNPISQAWRAYASVDEAVADYAAFLRDAGWNPNYQTAWARLVSGDPTFIRWLSAGGYFTLALPKYEAAFRDHLAQVRAMWSLKEHKP